MKRGSKLLVFLVCVGAVSLAADRDEETKRLNDATTTLTEMMSTEDKGIPRDLVDSSSCVIVIPGMKKGGFIVAAKYGRGFMTCRGAGGKGWRTPAAVRVEGGSVGFQIGGAETDVIMIVKSEKGAEKLTQDKFTVGGEASAAAGPVGRDSSAMTDAQMKAEMLSWSRSRGIFGGVSLQGATLREDKEANKALYGKELTSKEILTSALPAGSAQGFISALTKISPAKK